MPWDIAGRETTRLPAQDFVVAALQAPLALGHKLRRNAPVAVARDRQGQRAGVGLHGLLTLPVAGIPLLCPGALMKGLTQVGRQLGFSHPLHHPFRQVLQ
jgi:hypothetical protein